MKKFNNELSERGTTRRHTFFCTNKDRHSESQNIIEIHEKSVKVFGRIVVGWLITVEEPVIETIIPVRNSLQTSISLPANDPE